MIPVDQQIYGEWLEIYGDILQKFAFVILASYFLFRTKRFRSIFMDDDSQEVRKQHATIGIIFSVLGMIVASLGYLRYGESDWAFLDLQLVLTTLSGLLGGIGVGALCGTVGSLFRVLIGAGHLSYFAILIGAGVIGGVCSLLNRSGTPTRRAALLAGVMASMFHGVVIYQSFWRSVSFSVLSSIILSLMVLESLCIYVFVVVTLGFIGEERRKKLEKLLPEMKLKFLQAQINPHFLFNALNTIAAVCSREKAEQARSLIVKLSSYFRRIVKREDELVTLEEELDHIDNYLEIEKARYQNSLAVKKDIQLSARGKHALIPVLIIQPLVENAIRHGIANRPGGGLLEILAGENEKVVEITIRDNGMGMSPEQLRRVQSKSPKGPSQDDKSEGGGIGLRNINERLKYQFGREHQLSIKSEAGKGTAITLTLPLGSQKKE